MSMTYAIVITGENANLIAASQSTIYSLNGITQSIHGAKTAFQQLSSTGVTAFRGLSTEAELSRGKVEGFGIGLNQSLGAMRGLIFTSQISMFYMSMLTSSMMRQETTTNSVEAAQERYNEALREHGRGSKEARDAARSLESAQINYQRALAMSNIMMISMGVQAVNMGISLMSTIPALASTKLSVDALSTSLKGMWASMTPFGWAILGISIAAPLVAGALVLGGSPRSPTVNVNSSPDSNIIAAYMQRTGGNSIKAAG